MSVNGDQEEQIVSSLDDTVELLGEKRSSTREGALSTLIRELKMNYNPEFMDKRKLTISEALKRALKKGTIKEQILAAQLIALIAVTVGADSEDVYKEFASTMIELINKPPNEEVQSAIIESLAMLCFVCNTDEAGTLDILGLFVSICNQKASVLATDAALRGCCLLLTTVPRRYAYDNIIPDYLPLFFDFLSNDNVDIRVDAGEGIALLFEIGIAIEEDSFELYNFANTMGNIRADELLDKLYEFSADKSKARAKKEKAKQKVPFKEIISFIEEGKVPKEILSFKHQKFEFDSWAQLIQLNAFRDLLGEGLQTNFENNSLLHEVFDISLDKNAKKAHLTAVEKRMFMSPSSPAQKAKTKSLSKQRVDKFSAVEVLHNEDEQ